MLRLTSVALLLCATAALAQPPKTPTADVRAFATAPAGEKPHAGNAFRYEITLKK